MQTLQTILARALVRLAILAAPAGMADQLRSAIAPGAAGGPRPREPR